MFAADSELQFRSCAVRSTSPSLYVVQTSSVSPNFLYIEVRKSLRIFVSLIVERMRPLTAATCATVKKALTVGWGAGPFAATRSSKGELCPSPKLTRSMRTTTCKAPCPCQVVPADEMTAYCG